MMDYYGYDVGINHMMGWGIFGFVFSIIIWIVLIAIVIRLIMWVFFGRSWRHRHHKWYWDNSAMDILKERYAKGEINKEEFETKKKDLMD